MADRDLGEGQSVYGLLVVLYGHRGIHLQINLGVGLTISSGGQRGCGSLGIGANLTGLLIQVADDS